MPDENNELAKVREEIAHVQRQISLLPEAKRTPYETKLAELKRTEANLQEQLTRQSLRRLAGEVQRIGTEFGVDLQEIRAHIVKLTERVEKRVSPEEVAEIGRMVADMQMFLSGLMLPWTKKITEARTEKELWKRKIETGEAELVNEIIGKYAVYRSYHDLTTCKTYVETTPLPYGRS